MSGDEKQNLLLQDQDRIIVYSRWEKKDRPTVRINGAVRSPGEYYLLEGMTLRDLIFTAGNITDEAFMEKASLSRIVASKDGSEIIKIEISPKNILAGKEEGNITLKKHDVVHIREIPLYRQALNQKVSLQGEFLFPGEYTFSEGERISSVIQRAGGLTENAYPFGAVFLRESVKEIQKIRYREYLSQLEQDITAESALDMGAGLEKREVAGVLSEKLDVKEELIEKMKKVEPTGRMIINLEEVILMPSSKNDFQLRSGDVLIVDKKPSFVHILGEVYNPTAMVVEEGKDVNYYLDRVGGPKKGADKKRLFIVRANGTVISKEQGGFLGLGLWDQESHRWMVGTFGSIELGPGDTVIVPQKVEEDKWMQTAKDVSLVLYQAAIAAGVMRDIYDD